MVFRLSSKDSRDRDYNQKDRDRNDYGRDREYREKERPSAYSSSSNKSHSNSRSRWPTHSDEPPPHKQRRHGGKIQNVFLIVKIVKIFLNNF